MRSSAQILSEALDLLPHGWWGGREPDTYEAAALTPWADELSLLEAAMDEMLLEVDPRNAENLLDRYQAVLGADPCGRDQLPLSTADQALLVFQRWTDGGAMCAGYFINGAAAIGVEITITEYVRSCYGRAQYGGTQRIPSPNHLYFTVSLPLVRAVTAQYGTARYGDPRGSFTPNLMSCVVTSRAPLHTRAVISYS